MDWDVFGSLESEAYFVATDTWQGHKIDMSVGAQYYKLPDVDSQRFMKMVSFDTGQSAADVDIPCFLRRVL